MLISLHSYMLYVILVIYFSSLLDTPGRLQFLFNVIECQPTGVNNNTSDDDKRYGVCTSWLQDIHSSLSSSALSSDDTVENRLSNLCVDQPITKVVFNSFNIIEMYLSFTISFEC